MKVSIKQITIKNFKGVKSYTYEFDGKKISVKGQNGAGKTTIEDAYMWVMADKDSEIKSNPSIRPLGVEECTPRAEIVFDIDGKEVTAAKIQKCTVKKSKTGGADTVSLSNSYEVNSVNYGERDFKKKMQEYGFDFDLFLPLSHPDVFTSKEDADIRKVLFGMASEKSDYEIACGTNGAQRVALMLENYTLEEIKAMQNATLRKIREEYGKDGEILSAKIEGMELSKEDIDTAELELQKNELKRKLDENKERQADSDKQLEEFDKQTDGIMNLKLELNGLEQEANRELLQKKKDLRTQIDEKKGSLFRISECVQKNKREIAGYENDVKSGEKERQRLLDKWKEVREEQFDESTAICPTCHRELPEDECERLMSEFEKTKAERLAEIEKKGSEVKQDIDNAKEMIQKLQECDKDNFTIEKKIEKEIEELEKQLSELPDRIDISGREDVVEINRQIAEKEAAMQKSTSAKEIRQQLQDERDELQEQMDAVNEKLALAKKNIEIDEEIEKERKKQDKYEQNKADAEKILHQLDLVSKRKNELLSEEINSHFKLVKFRLFDYLKNGTVVDDCTPIIDGKSINDHSNGALRVLAKLDIIDGLQKFYGQSYPVFVDDFSLVTDNTECRIDVGCQLIKLIAEKGVKELKIEEEE